MGLCFFFMKVTVASRRAGCPRRPQWSRQITAETDVRHRRGDVEVGEGGPDEALSRAMRDELAGCF